MKTSTRITLVKRVADGFEKLLVLGLFQFNYYAIAVGISCFLISLALTYISEEFK